MTDDLRERVARAMRDEQFRLSGTSPALGLTDWHLALFDAGMAECRKDTDALVEALEGLLDHEAGMDVAARAFEHASALLARLKTDVDGLTGTGDDQATLEQSR